MKTESQRLPILELLTQPKILCTCDVSLHKPDLNISGCEEDEEIFEPEEWTGEPCTEEQFKAGIA